MNTSSRHWILQIITEKVSLKRDQKYAANRVAVLTMNGMNFDDMEYDTYLLPYTSLTVGSGLGQDDNLCSVFAPLNGPTNWPRDACPIGWNWFLIAVHRVAEGLT